MNKLSRLSPKTLKVLKLITEGHSYSQIVESNRDINYRDIFFAAEEAVRLDERIGNSAHGSEMTEVRPAGSSALERAKAHHPRAYAPWSKSEDAELTAMHTAGKSKTQMAKQFQRQPSEIQARLCKLGLIQS